MKLKLAPREETEECTHPVLKDCGEGYWWCMGCMERLTDAELVTLRATQAEEQATNEEEGNERVDG